MNTLVALDAYGMRDDQVWYVAHPVHPTDEEVAAWVRRLASPISGGCVAPDLDPVRLVILDNVANAKRWLAWLARRFPTITFIAPWAAALDGGGDDDLDPEQRARGLRDCCRTIRVCSGMVMVGGRVSGGMSEEASHARAVVDLTFLGRVPPAAPRGEPVKEEAKTKMVVVTENSVTVDGVTLAMVTGVTVEIALHQVPRVHITMAAPQERGGICFTGDAHVSQSIEKKTRSVVDQPAPVPRNDLTPVWENVISDFRVRYEDAFDGVDGGAAGKATAYRVEADMRERDRVGRERYGTPLTIGNGRDHLVDAYQEALDKAVYLRAAWLEGDQVRDLYYEELDSIMKIRTMIDARGVPK